VSAHAIRDHVRGVAVALVLLAHGVYALPLPSSIPEKRIREEGFQKDIDVWMAALGALGLSLPRARVERGVVDAANALHDVHTTLKAPFAPAMDLVGANQAWALFASTTTSPDRLEVSMRVDGEREWRVLLRRLDPCCTWREAALEYRRVRGVWDGQREAPRAGYKGLTKWIAAEVFSEFPEAREVRVRLLRETLTLPGEPPVDEVSVKHERLHRREPE
jgi:hypothetical protein